MEKDGSSFKKLGAPNIVVLQQETCLFKVKGEKEGGSRLKVMEDPSCSPPIPLVNLVFHLSTLQLIGSLVSTFQSRST